MRVSPSEVLQLAVRAESARQPDLARELYTLAGRMDRGPMPDGLEQFPPANVLCDPDPIAAAWARGFRLARRLGLSPDPVAAAESAGRAS